MGAGITFSSWLKQRRGELGVTQVALAEHISYALTTVQKIESGERRPSSQVIQLLAEYFRVPADERAAFTSFARGGTASIADITAPDATGMRTPWRNAHVRRTNVPAVLTSLIGRKQEQAAARDALLQPNVRLLTLTGPPGIGKTRLALKIASDLGQHFEDGVFWVELAAVVDPELVLATVARALGVKQAAGSPPEELLLDYVRERKMLLLLDNFEQVLDAATSVVQLMQASPWLKVLVTSREALHVRGERRLAVPPLALPDLAPFAWAGPAHGRQVVNPLPRADVLRSYPAIQLFVERAQTVSSAFEVTPENASDIAAICIELDGVPLAIELAAGRAAHFSLSAMRAALRHRLTLLTGGARDLPARHQTLRSAIAWSYGLLDPAEQTTFRALGVFATAPTLEAVHAVGSSTRAKDMLLALVDKNLVRLDDPDGDRPAARFSMSPAIQEYALDRLIASGAEDAVRRRHAEYYLAFAEEAEAHLTGAAQEFWLKRLEQEHDNLRAALQWAALHAGLPGATATSVAEADISMAELGLRLAGALWPFWDVAGYWSEGREQLATALAFPIPPVPAERWQRLRADALAGAASLAQEQGDNAETVALSRESLALRRNIGDKQGIASTLNTLASVAFDEGDYAQAGVLFEESLAIRRELGDRRAIASSLNNLGLIAREQGAYDAAGVLYAESLALRREVGDAGGIAIALNNLADLACLQHDYARAHALNTEGLAIKRQLGNKRGIAVSLGNLGFVAHEQGDFAQAGALYRESLAIRVELGEKLGSSGA